MQSAIDIAEKFFGGSKRKRNLCKTAIVISSIDAQVHVALYVPILGLIVQTFADQAPLVNFAFSVTSGVMVAFIFISGFLAQFIDKRTLMITGTIIFIAGGFCGSFSPSAEFLVAARAVEGVGAGLVYPMVPAITAQIFKGEERTALMGYTNGGSCAVTFVLNIAAGIVGRMCGWRACLFLYAILVITLFFQFKYIPKTGPERDALRIKKASGEKIGIPKAVWLYTLGFFALNTFGAAYQMILPVHVVEAGIGDSLLIGTASSANVCVGIFMGIVFGRIVKTFKRTTPAIALAFIAVAYLVWAQADNPIPIYIGMVLLGVCYGIMIPYMTEAVARVTNDDNVTLSMTILTAFGSLLGFFCLNFVVGILNGITNSNIFAEFIVLAVGFAVAFVIALVVGLRMNAKEKEWVD